MLDPQEGVRDGMWMSHDGLVWLEDMNDRYLVNAYNTCMRHNNPKADDVFDELERRGADWMIG